MSGFGRKKNGEQLPPPELNTQSSTTQDYMTAMGVPPTQQDPKKKKNRLDPGGQLYRGENRVA
jgi:hypothetical protein